MEDIDFQRQEGPFFTVTSTLTEGRTVSNVIFLCRFGSHLHGTTTSGSDLDLKAIFMATQEDLILGTGSSTYNISTGDKGRNSADDIDIEFIELRKFIRDAQRGQTYAVELLHVNEDNVILETPIFTDIRKDKGRLLTRNVKPFIGYCVSQAKKYGMKGSRLKATEDALAYLKEYSPSTTVEEVAASIPKNKYVFIEEKTLRGQDAPVPLLEVNGKQFNMAVKLKDVWPVLENLIDKYGARAHRAKDGVDWKAVGHAYRCIFELEELLTTGNIEFPLQKRDFLLQVKQGQVPYEQIQEELPELIERVEEIDTQLPEKPDESHWRDFLLTRYSQYVLSR